MKPIVPNYIASLTSLRFVAAMMIFLLHISGRLGVPNLRAVFALGSGVSFFYVLSGFILTFVYYNPEKIINWKSFFRKRFFRLWPLHFVTFIAAILLIPSVQNTLSSKLYQVPLQLTLTQSWLGSVPVAFGFNGPSWSVSTEFGFYLLFPFLIKLYRHIYSVFCIALVVTCLIGFIAMQTNGILSEWLWGVLHVHPFGRLIEFIFGICAAKLFFDFNNKSWSRTTFTILEIVTIFVVIAATMAIKDINPVIANFPNSKKLFGYLLCSGTFVFYGLLIWVLAYQKGMLSDVLSHRWAIFLGEISFAFYLIHQLVIRFFVQNPNVIDGHSPMVIFLSILTISLCLSFVAYKLVEMPFQKLGRHGPNVLFTEWKKEIKHWKIWCVLSSLSALIIVLTITNPPVPPYGQPLMNEVLDFQENSFEANISAENADVNLSHFDLNINRRGFCYKMLWKIGSLELDTPIMRIINVPFEDRRKTTSHVELIDPKRLVSNGDDYSLVFDEFCVPEIAKVNPQSDNNREFLTRIMLRQKSEDGYRNLLFKVSERKLPFLLLDLNEPEILYRETSKAK